MNTKHHTRNIIPILAIAACLLIQQSAAQAQDPFLATGTTSGISSIFTTGTDSFGDPGQFSSTLLNSLSNDGSDSKSSSSSQPGRGGPAGTILLTPAMTSGTAPAPYVATQSSYWSSDFAWQAFSGNQATHWSTAANTYNAGVGNEWMSINLGAIHTLCHVALFSRTGVSDPAVVKQNPRDLVVETSLDGVTFTPVITKVDIPQITVNNQKYLDEPVTPVQAQHVRVRVTRNWLQATTAIGEIELYGPDSSATGCLWTESGTNIHFSTGNVGINTSAPAYKLDVVGDINLIGEIRKNGVIWNPSNHANLATLDKITESAGLPLWSGSAWPGGGSGAWTQSGTNVHFSTGNVGIGTTNPTHKLSVSGTIRAKEIIVDTGWADYVFEENYQIPSLEAIEQHIKQNKHLPGIPTAQEIAAKGVSLGEMQALLLAKIEELTLHQIELNKRLNAQDAQIRELRAQNEQLLQQSR